MLLIAAKADPGEVMLAFAFIAVAAILSVVFGAVVGASTHWDVVVRNGLPYCPGCNRQVSYRRDYCRACGRKIRVYSAPPPDPGEVQRRALRELEDATRAAEEAVRRFDRERRLAEDLARKEAERDQWYRDRGVEPGPLAWYHVLPDWAQAVILGLIFAAPFALFIAAFMLVGRA